jgi:hypothetical protein
MVSTVMLEVAHFYGVFCFPLSTTQSEVFVAANVIARLLVAKCRDLAVKAVGSISMRLVSISAQVFVAIDHAAHHRALQPSGMTPSSVVHRYISREHTASIFSITNRIFVENLRNDLPD